MAYPTFTNRKVYLLLSNMAAWQQLTGFLDMKPEVLNWYMLGGAYAMLIVSRSDVHTLTEMIHVAFPNVLFILTEIDRNNTNGWMNPQVWDFVNQPKSSGRWEPPG